MVETIISAATPTPDPYLAIFKSINDSLQTPWYVDSQWWAIAIALLLGVLGIFQDFIRNLFQKPNLNVNLKLAPPDCHKISLKDPTTGQFICFCYYLRFHVSNNGNFKMEEVEVMANELYMKGANKRYVKVNNFLPINLKWAHNQIVTMPKIQPMLFKHCDFAHIIETSSSLGRSYVSAYGLTSSAKVIMILDTFVEPNTGSHVLIPGEYKINLIFAANNLKPVSNWYKLKLANAWDNNEKNMFINNLSIEKI